MKFISTILLVLLVITSSAQASNEFRFTCFAKDSNFNGFMELETYIEALMTIKDTEATLNGYDFSYKLKIGNEIWSQANINSKNLVSNNPKYRPRVYKNHYQFDISEGVFGKVKFLIPFNPKKTYLDHFNAVLIFTHIDDHAGDTVFTECSID